MQKYVIIQLGIFMEWLIHLIRANGSLFLEDFLLYLAHDQSLIKS